MNSGEFNPGKILSEQPVINNAGDMSMDEHDKQDSLELDLEEGYTGAPVTTDDIDEILQGDANMMPTHDIPAAPTDDTTVSDIWDVPDGDLDTGAGIDSGENEAVEDRDDNVDGEEDDDSLDLNIGIGAEESNGEPTKQGTNELNEDELAAKTEDIDVSTEQEDSLLGTEETTDANTDNHEGEEDDDLKDDKLCEKLELAEPVVQSESGEHDDTAVAMKGDGETEGLEAEAGDEVTAEDEENLLLEPQDAVEDDSEMADSVPNDMLQKRVSLVKQYAWIKQEMSRTSAISIADDLFQNFLLSPVNHEAINHCSSRRDAVEQLLKKILMGPNNIFDKFLQFLQEPEPHIADNLENTKLTPDEVHVFQLLEKSSLQRGPRPDHKDPRFFLTKNDCQTLLYYLSDKSNIHVDIFNDSFLSQFFFSIREHTNITNICLRSNDPEGGARLLLNTMKLCSDEIFSSLCKILAMDIQMEHVVGKLERKQQTARKRKPVKEDTTAEDEPSAAKQLRVDRYAELRLITSVQKSLSSLSLQTNEQIGFDVEIVDTGSIVIQLSPTSRDSWRRLEEKCTSGKIKDVIPVVYNNDAIQDLLQEGVYRLQFTIYTIHAPTDQGVPVSDVGHHDSPIEDHMYLLCEELEISTALLMLLKEQKMVEDNIKEDIDKQSSRSKKIKYLLNQVSRHGDRGYEVLEQHIKEANEYLYKELMTRQAVKVTDAHLDTSAKVTKWLNATVGLRGPYSKQVFFSGTAILKVEKNVEPTKKEDIDPDTEKRKLEISCPEIINSVCHFTSKSECQIKVEPINMDQAGRDPLPIPDESSGMKDAHRSILRRHRTEIIENVANPLDVAEELFVKEIFTDGMKEDVETSQLIEDRYSETNHNKREEQDASDGSEDILEVCRHVGNVGVKHESSTSAACSDTQSGSAGEIKQTARLREVPEKFKDEWLRDKFYSPLPPSIGHGPDNQLPDEENEDVIRILDLLSQPSKEKKSWPSFVPPETNTVYPVDATEPGPTVQQPHPSRDINLEQQKYIDDDFRRICPPGPDLEEYDPEMHKNSKYSGTDAENIDPLTLYGLFPDFSSLLPFERSLEEIGNEDDDPLTNFDLEKAIEGLELETTSTASNMKSMKTTQGSRSEPGPAENKTKLPIKHSSTSAMDTWSTNNPSSMVNIPVDHPGFKSEKDRMNEQLKIFLVTTTLQNVPVIQATNSAEQSVGAMPEPVAEAPQLTVNINIATNQHLQSTQAQTAPVTSPPLTLAISPSYGRSTSMAPLRSPRTPALTPNRRSQGSQRSTCTPKSQYDTQDELLNDFRGTAEEALSQHSESSHLRLFDDNNDAFGDTDDVDQHAELYCNSDELNPAQSLAAYLTDTEYVDSSFKVTFFSRINGTVLPIKFSGKDKARSWQHIVEEELCRLCEINNMFGAERFLLRHEDGGIVHLENDLGDQALTIYVEEATDVDIWWVERGMILH